jgi:hypothetical protein
MSSAFHPQTDGQAEAVNKMIGMYLRCMTGDRPGNWVRWLPWAEYIYNTAFHTALGDTPFRLAYGRDPPSIRSYEAGDILVGAVAQSMSERNAFLEDVRVRPEQAQHHANQAYDRHHREVSFFCWRVGMASSLTSANGIYIRTTEMQITTLILWSVLHQREDK